jgi:hypothetical protein
MADQSLIDQMTMKKESGGSFDVLKNVGDLQGFGNTVLTYAITLIAIGYVGATIINITNMTGKEIDDLLPTDLQSFPYQLPVGRTNPDGNSIAQLFSDYHASQDPESLTRATLELIYPMKRLSFPYTSWFLSKEFAGGKGHTLAQWFASTCAGTFCFWRKFYKILIVLGKWFHAVAATPADWFLFYVFPYITFYIIFLPVIPIVGFLVSVMSSSMYNIPGAWILTFAPFMGLLMAIANIITGGFFNFFSWVMSFLIFAFGFAMGWINLFWWALIGGALWLYTIGFLVLSPLLHKGGVKNVVEEFKNHRRSMLAIFTILVLIASFKYLSSSLSIGLGIGALLCFYKIYQMGKEGKAPVGVKPPVPAPK